MKRLLILVVGLALLASLCPVSVASAAGEDYDVVDGHFFPQAVSPTSSFGFTVTNDDGIPFWDEFRRLGGVQVVGYPISQRFLWDGFVTQVMQKAVFQWRPEVRQVYLVNVFDDLHDAGKDDWLVVQRSTPRPLPSSVDEGRPWDQVVADRLALLDDNPAIKAAYFASPDPIHFYGLPTSRIEFAGNHYAIRLQRAVIQQWTEDVPWAKAGEVTVANGGDIAKEAGLWPAAALVPLKAPVPAPNVVAAPDLPDGAVPAAQRVAVRAFPSVVKLSARGAGSGTGIIIDERGYVVTNYHVVGESAEVRVTLSDGRRLMAQVVGSDPWSDLALIRLEGGSWPALPLYEGDTFDHRQQVVAIGYSPALPDAPSVSTGVVSSLIGSQEPGAGSLLIHTSAPIFPGYSGGPLLNLDGQVVGIDTAIVATNGNPHANQGLSIAIASAQPIIEDLLANGNLSVPWVGIIPYTITPELRQLNNLSVEQGVVVVSVFSSSPAARAGLRKGDVIVKAQGQPVAKVGDLLDALSQMLAGQEAELEVVDLAGNRRLVKVTVESRPSLLPSS